MKLWLIKSNWNQFMPFGEEDMEAIKSIAPGEPLLFEYKKSRNPKFHRKYFAMLKLVFDNQEKYINPDHFRKVMQMKAGFYEAVETDKGTIYWPTSISYGSLDEIEFGDLYNKVLDVLMKQFGMEKAEIEDALVGFM